VGLKFGEKKNKRFQKLTTGCLSAFVSQESLQNTDAVCTIGSNKSIIIENIPMGYHYYCYLYILCHHRFGCIFKGFQGM